MPKQSAGLLMYRRPMGSLEVFLVHPGGPFWAKKDHGAWSIPKGQYQNTEQALDAAKREFQEETGLAPRGPFLELGAITQASGKIVTAWAFEGEFDPANLVSNTCQMEWPPRSGRFIECPEVDRGQWFTIPEASQRILKSQQPLLDTLAQAVCVSSSASR